MFNQSAYVLNKLQKIMFIKVQIDAMVRKLSLLGYCILVEIKKNYAFLDHNISERVTLTAK